MREHAREVVLGLAKHRWRQEVGGREQHLEGAVGAIAEEPDGRLDVAEHVSMVGPEAERAAMRTQCGLDFVAERLEAFVAGAHPGAGVVAEGLLGEGA